MAMMEVKQIRVSNRGAHPQGFEWNGKVYVVQPHPSHKAGTWVRREAVIQDPTPKINPLTVGPGKVPGTYFSTRREVVWEKVSDAPGAHIALFPEDLVANIKQTKLGPVELRNSILDLDFDAGATDDFAIVAEQQKLARTEAEAKLAEMDLALKEREAELKRLQAQIAGLESSAMLAKAKSLSPDMKPSK